MNPILSICIPTYNRAIFLKECLDSVLPQVINIETVEVIVIDNASADDTQAVVKGFMESYCFLKYYRNESNLGYAGNQVKCIEYASGAYMALLCDDDAYLDGEVNAILAVISNKEYAMIALNYYGFLHNKNIPYKTNFVEEKNVIFSRAYDILMYPSVGHFSGLIINLRLAKETLANILAKRSYESFEKIRGVIVDICVCLTLASDLPAYFIGRRGVAARMPDIVDYNTLQHLCVDYYDMFYNYYVEGLITEVDLAHNAKLTLGRLPSGIVTGIEHLTNKELIIITDKLKRWFAGNPKFDYICFPLLWAGQFPIIKTVFKGISDLVRSAKRIHREFNKKISQHTRGR
jgi:glycosyltransferase involved in cell wall biosynthesis